MNWTLKIKTPQKKATISGGIYTNSGGTESPALKKRLFFLGCVFLKANDYGDVLQASLYIYSTYYSIIISILSFLELDGSDLFNVRTGK